MAQPATNPKIEELRGRLKADPKSRFFYQLAEELRRAGQPAEAEQVLRTGLATHPTYLAAWVSLGRACREQKRDQAAVDALSRALQLDPGNVVAARLLGDAYLGLGDKLEAIKKYKLVHALLPSDEELEATIHRLDAELNPPPPAALASMPEEEQKPARSEDSEPAPAEVTPAGEPEATAPFGEPEQAESTAPLSSPAALGGPGGLPLEESPFDRTQPPFAESDRGEATGDSVPMLHHHDESPFEEPVSGFSAASAQIEVVSGYGIESAHTSAERPLEQGADDPRSAFAAPSPAALSREPASLEAAESVFAPVEEPGAVEGAEPSPGDRAARLERWLGRIRNSEASRV